MTQPDFCYYECPFLKPCEYDQSDKKEPHWCEKYDKQVKHYGYHPNLVKLEECRNDVQE